MGGWRITVASGTDLLGERIGDEGPAVALVHGGASSRRWWDAVALRLAPGHRVACWDQRGHGASGPAHGRCTVQQLAADTLDVLDALGLDRTVLVGHSVGASVALEAAVRSAPGRIASVVCVDGGLYDPRRLLGATWHQAWTASRAGRRPISPAVLAAWVDGAGLGPSALPAVRSNFTAGEDGRLTLRLSAQDEEQLAHSVWTHELSRVLPAVGVPVAILAADDPHDPRGTGIRRESIERARAQLAVPLTEVWIAGGHDLPLERPDAVAHALEALSVLGGGDRAAARR